MSTPRPDEGDAGAEAGGRKPGPPVSPDEFLAAHVAALVSVVTWVASLVGLLVSLGKVWMAA